MNILFEIEGKFDSNISTASINTSGYIGCLHLCAHARGADIVTESFHHTNDEKNNGRERVEIQCFFCCVTVNSSRFETNPSHRQHLGDYLKPAIKV